MEMTGAMLSSVPDDAVRTEDIAGALEESYTVYSSFLPSYDDISQKYLSAVAGVLNREISKSLASVIYGAAASLDESGPLFFDEAGLASELKNAALAELKDRLLSALEENEEYLDEAFEESRSSFSMVKKTYAILSRVGENTYLPEAGKIDYAMASSLACERCFMLLADNGNEGDSVHSAPSFFSYGS